MISVRKFLFARLAQDWYQKIQTLVGSHHFQNKQDSVRFPELWNKNGLNWTHTCLPGVWNFKAAGRGWRYEHSPTEMTIWAFPNRNHEVLSLLRYSLGTLHKNCPLLLGGMKTTGGLLESFRFPWVSNQCDFFFLFARFTLCPFSIINLGCAHGYMSPASPNKLLSLVENSLGDSWHRKHDSSDLEVHRETIKFKPPGWS